MSLRVHKFISQEYQRVIITQDKYEYFLLYRVSESECLTLLRVTESFSLIAKMQGNQENPNFVSI